jgi:hypothetical protein
MRAICSENFITVGRVETPAVYIQAEKIYFGGTTTTLPENVHLITPFEPSIGDDEAAEAAIRVVNQVYGEVLSPAANVQQVLPSLILTHKAREYP